MEENSWMKFYDFETDVYFYYNFTTQKIEQILSEKREYYREKMFVIE